MDVFEQAFAFVVGHGGGYTALAVHSFGAGWSRRLCALPFQAVQMGGQA